MLTKNVSLLEIFTTRDRLILLDEFGNWTPERSGFTAKNIEQYIALPGVGKSAPEEDFWDRNALYCLWVSSTNKFERMLMVTHRNFDCQAAALYPEDEKLLKL